MEPKSFLYYWKPKQAEAAIGGVLRYVASDQLKAVSPGDALFVVTTSNGCLHLLGRLDVGEMADRARAEEVLGATALRSASHYALARDTPARITRLVAIHHIAAALRFQSEASDHLVIRDGTNVAHQLQSMRRLTDLSARILEEVIAAAEEKTVRSIESPTGPLTERDSGASQQEKLPEAVDDSDSLEQVWRRIRRGQSRLRETLLALYSGRCAISDHGPEVVLQAAHLDPHAESGCNRSTNAILLRADLHGLLDEGLLAIEPTTLSVWLHDALVSTPYGEFAGRRLRERSDGVMLDSAALELRWHRRQT